MTDVRPISLCNVLIRILSKVLANRLKECLSSLISDHQSAFVEGRMLTDNALIAFELNHYIKRKTQGGNGVVGFKIDISKAYDRLEWRYLEGILHKFGFSRIWVERIMKCVTTVFCRMVVFLGMFNQNGKLGEGTLFPLTYIFYVQRGSVR